MKIFANFGGASDGQEDTSQGIKSFVCTIYGYPPPTPMDLICKEIYVWKYKEEEPKQLTFLFCYDVLRISTFIQSEPIMLQIFTKKKII